MKSTQLSQFKAFFSYINGLIFLVMTITTIVRMAHPAEKWTIWLTKTVEREEQTKARTRKAQWTDDGERSQANALLKKYSFLFVITQLCRSAPLSLQTQLVIVRVESLVSVLKALTFPLEATFFFFHPLFAGTKSKHTSRLPNFPAETGPTRFACFEPVVVERW